MHSLSDPRIDYHEGKPVAFGIDTGCCYGGRLTAMILKEDKPTDWDFVQVQAEREYSKWYTNAGGVEE